MEVGIGVYVVDEDTDIEAVHPNDGDIKLRRLKVVHLQPRSTKK